MVVALIHPPSTSMFHQSHDTQLLTKEDSFARQGSNSPISMTSLLSNELQKESNGLPSLKKHHSKSRSKKDTKDVKIRLLLVSGKKKDFYFDKSSTIWNIKEYIFENWPTDWRTEMSGNLPENIRLLYRGKFLSNEIVLKDIDGMFSTSVITFHLVPKVMAKSIDQTEKKNNFCKFACFPCDIM